MKNQAAVKLGRLGGSAGTMAQQEARIKVAAKMREARAANRLKAKQTGRKPDRVKGKA